MDRSLLIRHLARWLALAGLVAASIVLWQTRFKAVAHPVNGDAGFGRRFDGWTTSGGENGWRQDEGVPAARFARPAGDGEFSSATRWFGALDELRFLHVETEVRWNDVITGGANWASLRLVMVSKDSQQHTRFTWDHGVFLALGTRGWHSEEAVFELTPEMSDVGFAFETLGKQGSMDVRSFRITALNQRAWVPAAAAVLLAAWALWLAALLRRPAIPWWRALPAAAVVVAASWFLIFPGPRMQARPLIGTFLTGPADHAPADHAPVAAAEPRAITPEPAATNPDAPGPRSPRMRVIPNQPAPRETPPGTPETTVNQPPATPSSAAMGHGGPPAAAAPPPIPPPEPRSQPTLTDAIRNLDLKLDLIHLASFFALSLAVFLTTGALAPWRVLGVVGLLSEIVPDWYHGWYDAADLLDLAANLGGTALAAGTFVVLARLVKRFSTSGS